MVDSAAEKGWKPVSTSDWELLPGEWIGPGIESGKELHVCPVNDLRPHEVTRQCWCRPKEDAEESLLIVHNSMDGRENYENGKLKRL